MRIEKREDGEYLVDAPIDCDVCDAVHVDAGPCCHHLNGEHLAVSYPGGDGVCFILARWPIESAPAPQPERLFSTPAEARAASAEHIRTLAAEINRDLAAGQRWFSALKPLFPEICSGLQRAGWRVYGGSESMGRKSFTVAESGEEQEGER